MNADLDLQRREYVMAHRPECDTCGAELDAQTMILETNGYNFVQDVFAFCSKRCAENYEPKGGAA